MEKTEKAGGIKNIIKGIFTSIIVTLIGTLIFAGILKLTLMSASVIKAVNQFIKILAIFLGCSSCIRDKGGLIKGMIIGISSIVINYLLFWLFGSQISFGVGFIVDLIFGLIVGGISGIISVNVKK